MSARVDMEVKEHLDALVAAGVSPAVEPGRPARRNELSQLTDPKTFRGPGRAAGRQPSTSGGTPDATAQVSSYARLVRTGEMPALLSDSDDFDDEEILQPRRLSLRVF